jgi:hypothetical protein
MKTVTDTVSFNVNALADVSVKHSSVTISAMHGADKELIRFRSLLLLTTTKRT